MTLQPQEVDLEGLFEQTKKCFPVYFDFLSRIESYTESHDSKIIDSYKILASATFRDLFSGNEREGLTASVGAGADWRFPLALGARTVDMIDIVYPADCVHPTSILQSIIGDPCVRKVKQSGTELRFNLNLFGKYEKVLLRFIKIDARNYIPEEPLSCVIEVNGPTFPSTSHKNFVFPHLQSHIIRGAFILNFSAYPEWIEREQPDLSGYTVINKNGIICFQKR